MSRLLEYWPVLVVAAGLAGSTAVDSWRLNALAQDAETLEAEIGKNEEAIDEIERLLIERRGSIALDLQAIRGDQEDLQEDLDEILRLLREIQND